MERLRAAGFRRLARPMQGRLDCQSGLEFCLSAIRVGLDVRLTDTDAGQLRSAAVTPPMQRAAPEITRVEGAGVEHAGDTNRRLSLRVVRACSDVSQSRLIGSLRDGSVPPGRRLRTRRQRRARPRTGYREPASRRRHAALCANGKARDRAGPGETSGSFMVLIQRPLTVSYRKVMCISKMECLSSVR